MDAAGVDTELRRSPHSFFFFPRTSYLRFPISHIRTVLQLLLLLVDLPRWVRDATVPRCSL